MREDVAALNVTRTYTLAASNIAIFTLMLVYVFFVGRYFPRMQTPRVS